MRIKTDSPLHRRMSKGGKTSGRKCNRINDYEKELERSFRTINEGDIVSGTVIAVSEEDVTLDLNYYTQGIIKTENLSNDPDFNPKEQLQIGDVIEATVIKVDDGNGNIELSKKEANDVLAWDKLAEMMENETVVNVRIKESVPSGVVAFLEGIRAFIPASQLSTDYVEDTDKWIGKEVEVAVINVDKELLSILETESVDWYTSHRFVRNVSVPCMKC